MKIVLRTYYRLSGFAAAIGILAAGTPALSWAQAGPIQAEHKLPPASQKLADEFAAQVAAILPSAISETIQDPILIRFSKLDDHNEIIPPLCPGESKKTISPPLLGTTSLLRLSAQRRIVLNQNFLKVLAQGPQQASSYPCGHGNLYRLALATAVHEISHLYLKAKGSSFKDDYRDFQAWKRGLFNGHSKNRLFARSPDQYEYKNLAEHFAVNAEYFFLDPEYRCRRPEQYQYFEKHFNYSPFPMNATCRLNTDVRLSTSLIPVTLDPSRVYEIHYLLADRGTAVESRWGHAMYRIIQCAPHRTEVGPECVQDIGNHIVVSFRANISGVNSSKLGGFSGKYPSQLFLFSMPEIVGEYTMSESRPLKSIPLRLSGDQVSQFARRTLELYWEYQGKYFFFGNNCATESLHFLAGVLASSNTPAPSAWLATPTGLYEKLKKLDLLHESVLSAPQATGRYFFPSFRSRAEEAFRKISLRPGFYAGLTLDQFARDYDASARRALYESIKTADSTDISTVAIHFYALELLIREKLNARLKKHASRLVDESLREPTQIGTPAVTDKPSLAELVKRAADLRTQLQPWFFANRGYGVPLPTDYQDLNQFNQKIEAIRKLATQIIGEIRNRRSEVFEDFATISQNTMFFMMEIKNEKNGN